MALAAVVVAAAEQRSRQPPPLKMQLRFTFLRVGEPANFSAELRRSRWLLCESRQTSKAIQPRGAENRVSAMRAFARKWSPHTPSPSRL